MGIGTIGAQDRQPTESEGGSAVPQIGSIDNEEDSFGELEVPENYPFFHPDTKHNLILDVDVRYTSLI